MKIKGLLLALSCMGFSVLANEQCLSGVDRKNPSSRYKIVDTQFAIDKATNLMWTRCADGSTINEYGYCTRNELANKNVMEAIAYANSTDLGGFTNWRIPNVKELQSLLDRTCGSETINKEIFPEALTVLSSTPNPNRVDTQFLVRLSNGTLTQKLKEHDLDFILVRDVE